MSSLGRRGQQSGWECIDITLFLRMTGKFKFKYIFNVRVTSNRIKIGHLTFKHLRKRSIHVVYGIVQVFWICNDLKSLVLSVSERSVRFCQFLFHAFWSFIVRCNYKFLCPDENGPFYHHEMSLLISYNTLCLEVSFIWNNIAPIPAFLCPDFMLYDTSFLIHFFSSICIIIFKVCFVVRI